MSGLFGNLFGVGGRGGALALAGSASFAAGAAGAALGSLAAPAVFTVFSKVAGSAKIACSATGILTTNAATAAAEVLSARFRVATADGARAIEETFTFTATGAAAPGGGQLDFSDPANSGLQPAL